MSFLRKVTSNVNEKCLREVDWIGNDCRYTCQASRQCPWGLCQRAGPSRPAARPSSRPHTWGPCPNIPGQARKAAYAHAHARKQTKMVRLFAKNRQRNGDDTYQLGLFFFFNILLNKVILFILGKIWIVFREEI